MQSGERLMSASRLSVVAAFFCLVPALASAEHEIDHRYNVTGFVLDESGRPLGNSGVSIRMGDSAIGYQETNAQGYYNIRLHLHDTDLGRKLTVKTQTGEATIAVTFTLGDHATRRIHYANLIGGKLTEGPLSRWRYAAWVYIAPVAAVLLLSAGFVVERRLRRARKRRLAQERKAKKGKR